MKTWQLALVQLWVLCFMPVWLFVALFAPLVLAPPNTSWSALLLLLVPLVVSCIGSVCLWLPFTRSRVRLQKQLAWGLVILQIIFCIPLLFWQ